MANFILIFCCIFFGLPQTCLALTVTFNEAASVSGSAVTLSDIASFDEQSDLAKALGSQVIAQAPSPGETIYLRSFTIKQYLENSQSLSSDIYWNGSDTVALLRQGITISSDRILEIIDDFIEQNKEDLPEAEIRFVPNALPLPFTLPKGDLAYEVIPSSPGIIRSSRFSIIFRIGGKVVRNMSVRGEIEALATVVVTATRLKKGSIIRPQHLTTAKKDISEMSNPGVDQNALIGKKLKKTIRAGHVILSSMVESLPVVQRGERVKIVIKSGTMLLTATGLAHNNGLLNEIIRVQNISSNKIIFCRVAAPGLVEVLL